MYMAADPAVSLALTMASGPGQYALLIGSGISTAAGIPSGWAVTLDLVKQVSVAADGEPTATPEAWWSERRSEPMSYSALLAELAPLPAERQQLLRSYFEPTEEEREAGLKTPAAAHRAIGKLVAAGLVKVIITTNFDRLLEQAIQDEGVAPVVIASPDQADGASPLVHNQCTILKVNGDYLDTRIKNSEDELSSYDPRIDALLDRILDEYGLIVVGWSGDWDIALRAAIERAKGRRYTTYWCTRGVPSDAATSLINHRAASVVTIKSADEFFTALADRVRALRESGQDPESTAVAVAQLKRYLPRPEDRIRYAELLRDSVEDVRRSVASAAYPLNVPGLNDEIGGERARAFEALSDRTLRLLATSAYWGDRDHHAEVVSAIARLADFTEPPNGQDSLFNLTRYPALLGMYAAGVAWVARGNYERLQELFTTGARTYREKAPLMTVLFAVGIVHPSFAEHLLGRQRLYTPVSERLFAVLREPMRELIPSDADYQEIFDRFEYLLTLAQADWYQTNKGRVRASFGAFMWRHWSDSDDWMPRVVAAELEQNESTWPPLVAGMFGGDLQRLLTVKPAVDKWAAEKTF